MALSARFHPGENFACCSRARLGAAISLRAWRRKRRTQTQRRVGKGGGDPDAPVDAAHLVVFRPALGLHPRKATVAHQAPEAVLLMLRGAGLAPSVD
jgi:hypothetical protein